MKLETITFGADEKGWLEVDSKNYWVETRPAGGSSLPELLVYDQPGGECLGHFRGSSLIEGTDEANTDYIQYLIRERI